ncbi:hypothetical protein ABT061_15720 [Streptosporangium sp. NPDC002544]|uniref:hypothetical protein n=1 Tax=Streptosporangium sp. NPDC002544 TaxID=3154538 RepID=UPI00332CF763
MTDFTPCGNPDHPRPTRAIVRMSWPDSRFRPTTACIGDMEVHVRASIDEGHAVLVQPVTPRPRRRQGSTYLVWSNEQRSWWGPGGANYTGDVWAAGRYDEAEATKACGMRTWSQGSPPPEVMVLAPENDCSAFTLDDIRAVPDLMRDRIAEATRSAVAEREAAQQAPAEDGP